MTVAKKNREIAKRIVLKGKVRNLSGGDALALFSSLVMAIQEPKVGFNHATTDVPGWLSSFAPYGVSMDDAFVEDMLYAANLLNELGKYRHPQGKTFEQTLKSILRPIEAFDLDTNEIGMKEKQ